jgi:hypothetical protein
VLALHVHTIMVKAAPRFATILCLYYVRLAPCLRVRFQMHTAGWATTETRNISFDKAGGLHDGRIRTLAMPIGDRFSAMVGVVWCGAVRCSVRLLGMCMDSAMSLV